MLLCTRAPHSTAQIQGAIRRGLESCRTQRNEKPAQRASGGAATVICGGLAASEHLCLKEINDLSFYLKK